MAINTKAIAIAFDIVEFLAVTLTLLRLAFRIYIQRFWWEDVWATVAMVCATAFAIVDLMYFLTQNFETAEIDSWIASYAFTSIVWSVRMSLLYSIVRITSPSAYLGRLVRAIGALFALVWALLLALKTWWCMLNSDSQLGRPICSLPHSVAIFEVAADFAGDGILVILSLRLLWRVKLPQRQRRMILLIFSSSAIISMGSLPHAIAQIFNNEDLEIIFTDLEVVLSLIVCNLLVVVTYAYRVYVCSPRSENSSDDDDFTTPVSRGTESLTTVDLNTPNPTMMMLPPSRTPRSSLLTVSITSAP